MKIKYALLLFILGLCTYAVGVVFKITHWTEGDALLLTAAALVVAGIALATINLLLHPKIRRFLNF